MTKTYKFLSAVLFTSLLVVVFSFKFTLTVNAETSVNIKESIELSSESISSDKIIKVPPKAILPKKKVSYSRGENVAYNLSDSNNSEVVTYAFNFLGAPYVWGATGPRAFDCSGFVMYVYSKFGVGLPHYTGAQINCGQAVSKGNLKAGDLVFFNTYGSVSHVGMYVGNGDFIHAGSSRTGVIVSNMNTGYYSGKYAGARRVR